MSPISTTPGRPLYRQVEKRLRESIESGEYGVDTPLPDERRLAKAMGVSRTTIRQAIKQLSEDNLVKRVQGSGTFVSPDYASGQVSSRVSSRGYICFLAIGKWARYCQLVARALPEAHASAERASLGLCVEYADDMQAVKEVVTRIQANPAIVGVLLVSAVTSSQAVELAAGSRIPWVMLGEFSGNERSVPVIDQVIGDEFYLTEQAARHLTQKGCRRAAIFLHAQDKLWTQDAISAFRMVMDDAGIFPVDQQIVDMTANPLLGGPQTQWQTNLAIMRHTLSHWAQRNRWPDGLVMSGTYAEMLDLCLREDSVARKRLENCVIAVRDFNGAQYRRCMDCGQATWFLIDLKEMVDRAMWRLQEPWPRDRSPVRDYVRNVQMAPVVSDEKLLSDELAIAQD